MEAVSNIVKPYIDSELAKQDTRLNVQADGMAAQAQELIQLRGSLAGIQLKEGPQGEAGECGKDGESIDPALVANEIADQVGKAVAELPKPRDGVDGKNVTQDDIRAIVADEVGRAVADLPKPQNGKDAEPVDQAKLCEEIARAVQALPRAKDGEPGPIGLAGKDADPELMREQIAEEVAKAVAAIPKAKDGDIGPKGPAGKDAEPIHPDTIALMVTKEVQAAVAALPPSQNGKDGEPGRDALQVSVLPSIDIAKSYPRGTWALYNGGTMLSHRATDPITDGAEKAGWDFIHNPVVRVEMVQHENLKTFTYRQTWASGKTEELAVDFPVIIYRGVWREGTYTKGDTSTWAGSLWIAECETTTKPGDGNPDWRLAVKRGADGKDSKR